MKHIAIITGASSGFGREYALQCSSLSPHCCPIDELWLIARRKDRLEAVQQEIVQAGQKVAVRCIQLDIAQRLGMDGFKNLLAQEQQKGSFSVSLLINNAGFGAYGFFSDLERDRQLASIAVNVEALTAFCYEALPFMQEGASIINIASMAAFIPMPKFAVYAATTSYVLSFSIALEAELKEKGIGVYVVCPGAAKTEFSAVAINSPHAQMPHPQNPADIVSYSLTCLAKKKKMSIYGLGSKIMAFGSRFFGRYFIARYIVNHVVRIYKQDTHD